MGIIFYFSSKPYVSGAESIKEQVINNALHIPAFGLLAYFLLKGFSKSDLKTYILTFAIVFFYSVIIEFYQLFVPGRFASINDVLLNMFGVILTFWVYKKWHSLHYYST
jgi:VanZ family protein